MVAASGGKPAGQGQQVRVRITGERRIKPTFTPECAEMTMESGRILLVDDDPDILRILKDNLELDNYRVIAAKTGKEALQCFEKYSIALIVLDLFLPDIDGIQVCRSIREKIVCAHHHAHGTRPSP